MIQGLYGRAVKGGGHYYTPNRGGLYPEYPDMSTTTLLLTESVIDAACILGVLDEAAVLALYGTNGLAAEHRLEIKEMKNLTEVVLALDGDEAGRKATVAIAAEVRAIKPGLRVTTLGLPDGEDINGLWVSHADEEGAWLKKLFERRRLFGEEAPKPEAVALPATGELTVHPHYLEYLGLAASYRVRGGMSFAAA